MKSAKFLCVIALIALFGLVRNADWKEEDNVIVLTVENFDQVIQNYEHVLVEFYAPWCGHCKKLAPEYAAAAKELKNSGLKIALAKLDSTANKPVGEKFKIKGFPTLKLFSNSTVLEYNGGRTASGIVSWMLKNTRPALRTLTTVAEVESFQKSADVAVVYFGDNEADKAVFNIVAKSSDDIVFATCASEECIAHYNVKSGNVVKFSKLDEARSDFTENLKEAKLKAFITKNSSPLVMKFDEKSSQLIFAQSTPGLFLYRDSKNPKTAELEKIFKSVAKKVQGIKVIITDIKTGIEAKLAQFIGVTFKNLPTVRIHDTRKGLKKYNLEGAITEESVLQFVNDWENGRLQAHYKSQEIPKNQRSDVVVLVGKNFHEIVMDPTKDVLVEFYSPKCGHCKKLEPIYSKVAKNHKTNSGLVIAKMDSTLNEVEEVLIQNFPTIKFWPANNKSKPIDFDGARTVEGFTKWLGKHSNKKVEIKDDL